MVAVGNTSEKPVTNIDSVSEIHGADIYCEIVKHVCKPTFVEGEM